MTVHTIHTLPVSQFDTELQRDHAVYVATSVPEPILLQTPVITLASPLTVDDELQDFVTLKFKKAHLDTFSRVESTLLELAKDRKKEWFRNEDLSDDTIDAAFKTFIDPEAKTLRVRVDELLSAYDSKKQVVDPPAQGTKIKAILELKRATFTKSQFGAVWTLKHVRLVDEERAYLFDPEETPDYAEHITDQPLDDHTLLAAYHDDDDAIVEDSL